MHLFLAMRDCTISPHYFLESNGISRIMFLGVLVLISSVAAESQTKGEDVVLSGLNTMASQCSQISTADGVYRKVTPSSKYLVYTPFQDSETGFTRDTASKLCQDVGGLQIAEVTHKFDLMTLEKNLQVDAWIGLNDKSQSGHWYQANGGKIRFQTFVGTEPNNFGEGESCVILRLRDGYIIMEDAVCNSVKAGALCQFEKASDCFKQSAEELAREKGPNFIELEAVGTKYYLSTEQKMWEQAKLGCTESEHGLQLVTLDDPDHYRELVEGVIKKIAERHLHPATQFWVSGKFLREGNDYELNLFLGQEGNLWVREDDITVAHEWAPATSDEMEPINQAHHGSLQCLDISFENMGTHNNAPYWRASTCIIPKYYICETVDNTISNSSLENITTIDGGPDDNEDMVNQTIVSCNTTSKTALTFEVELDKPQTDEEVLKFMVYSLENDLRSGNIPVQVREEIQWKSDLINLLADITKAVADNDYVDHGMLNVVKFLNIVYHNMAKGENETVNADKWAKKYIPHFKECLQSSAKKLNLQGTGFEVTAVAVKGEILQIFVPEEVADRMFPLDLAIDMFWYMFSLSLATCFNQPEKDRLSFASDLHISFVKDFIQPMRQRWTINTNPIGKNGTSRVDQSYIMGDVDFRVNYRNLRCAVSAAYTEKGLEGTLQLVRPLDMTTVYKDKPMPFENGKTGSALY